jgi:predicted DCC family thiol-disulfide oxidoreductase YuxK
MCNGIVRFLMRRDPARRLLYAPLDSRLGREMVAQAGLAAWKIDGVVLIEAALTPAQRVSARSEAAARLLLLLPGGWPLAGWMLAAVPRGLRECAYRCVARWRYRLFRAYEACPLPSAEERKSILGTEG